MKLPSRIYGNAPELAEFLNPPPPVPPRPLWWRRDIGQRRQELSGDNEIPGTEAISGDRCSDRRCRIFVEDGAKLRVVKVIQYAKWSVAVQFTASARVIYLSAARVGKIE